MKNIAAAPIPLATMAMMAVQILEAALLELGGESLGRGGVETSKWLAVADSSSDVGADVTLGFGADFASGTAERGTLRGDLQTGHTRFLPACIVEILSCFLHEEHVT